MTYHVQGAALASTTTGVLSSGQLRRLLVLFTAIALAITLMAIEAPTAVEAHIVGARAQAASSGGAQRVVRYANSHLGKRFRIGSEGMRYFDCSGLVYRVYAQARLLKKIGGTRKRAASYFKWFKQRGLVSRGNPRPGDLIWYTTRGRIVHMGLYVGGNRAISALINPWGVRRHTVRGVRVRFLAYGHTRLSR